MIYAGKKTSDTGPATTIGNSAFNEKNLDPAYVGYMYSENFSLHENNGTTLYDWFTNTKKYDFGTGYTFNESTKKFTLTGTIQQLTWKDNHEEIVSNNLYSCLETSCNVVYKVTDYPSDTRMTVQPISYSSNSYDYATTNKISSTIKSSIDTWYENNIKNYSSYIASNNFCNDRSLRAGSGYLTSPVTYYSAHYRLETIKAPSLNCTNTNDSFSTTNSSAKLDYPVSLITADEVSMAGAVNFTVNNDYYLYSNVDYWTLTPFDFYSMYTGSRIYLVRSDGELYPWIRVFYSRGVRPVINLKSDVKISSGDGTSIAPFTIALN